MANAKALTLTAIQLERERLRRADAEAIYRAINAARESSVVLIESALTTSFVAGLNAATVHGLHYRKPRRRSKGKP